ALFQMWPLLRAKGKSLSVHARLIRSNQHPGVIGQASIGIEFQSHDRGAGQLYGLERSGCLGSNLAQQTRSRWRWRCHDNAVISLRITGDTLARDGVFRRLGIK